VSGNTSNAGKGLIPTQKQSTAGYLFALAATAFWSSNFIVARGLSDSIPPVTITFLRSLVAVVVLIPFGIRPFIIYLGVGPSLFAYFCWNRAIVILGPVRTGLVYYCLPLFSGVGAFLLLNESVHWVQVLSGVLILAGVMVATREWNLW